ncbi:hypothetical protein IW261DRAFT_1422820 [Armillaria novae-zelandiae]|uniref:Uncharacterized protein n=1 Tax=Armillaria novae-zelandiae TaxID=153914 RepID=A0AA39NZG1_9AGAR|nr:hypothetical protein IW261DRAFT_1422820 [Armillaria novae-zelandiae]
MGNKNGNVAQAQSYLRQWADPSLNGTIQDRWKFDKKNIPSEILWSLKEYCNTVLSKDGTIRIFLWTRRFPLTSFKVPERFGAEDFKVAFSAESINEARQLYAPPDHPVLKIIPDTFATLAHGFIMDLGNLEVNQNVVWDIYLSLRAKFYDAGIFTSQDWEVAASLDNGVNTDPHHPEPVTSDDEVPGEEKDEEDNFDNSGEAPVIEMSPEGNDLEPLAPFSTNDTAPPRCPENNQYRWNVEVYIYRNIFDHTYGGKCSALQQNNRRCQIDNLSTNTTAMSTEALQFENAYTKQSSLVWLLPILCQQFLTTPLDPEKWIWMQAVTSDQDREILEFGKAMGRTLKFVADESWSKGDPPKDSIDFILPVHGTHKSANHLDTLVLVKAMDIAAGFLRLPTRSYYPSFGKVIKLENSHVGYLKRLDDWPRKLEQIQTSFRMYSERTSILLPAVVPGRDEGEVILHNDICLLANHWKHESAESWLKALCILDGVTFHIRVLCFNNSPLAPWSGTDIIVEKHPDVQMIMANNDTLKKFKENLPRWKQVFANAVAISPLVLILGKGISQMLNTSQALQNPIPGLESKAGIHTCQWLQSTEDKWMASLVRTKGVSTIEAKQGYTAMRRRGRSRSIISYRTRPSFPGFPHDDVRKVHQCLTFRVQRWGHENFCDFLYEKTGKEPWHLPAATAPLTMEDVDPMSVEEIIVRNMTTPF